MSSIATQFATRIRHNIESWQAREVDYIEYTANQQDVWTAVRAAGPAVEEEVVAALYRAAAASGLPPRAYGLTTGALGRSLPRATRTQGAQERPCHHYHAFVRLSEPGSPALQIVAADPSGPCAAPRNMAAFIYEAAADLERQSLRAGAQWGIIADPYDYQIVIQVEGDHEAALAYELLDDLINRYELIDAR